jgi:hypothetical protein
VAGDEIRIAACRYNYGTRSSPVNGRVSILATNVIADSSCTMCQDARIVNPA